MNQSNLVHQHVYYSNRFEPGKLFPEIISNSFNNNMYGDQTLRALISYSFSQPDSLGAGGDSFTTTSIGEYPLRTQSGSLYNHVPLYYTAPTEDFNMENDYVGLIVFSGTTDGNYELNSTLTTQLVKDFSFTDAATIESEYTPIIGAVNTIGSAPVSDSPVTVTTVSTDTVIGSVAFNASIQ